MGIIKQQTIKGTSYSYLGVLIGFISTSLILPHAISKEQLGLTATLLTYSQLFAQFATLGFSGTSRYFPYFRNDEKKHNGYLFLFCTISLIGSLILTAVIYFFRHHFISAESQKSALFEEYYWYLIPLTIFTVYFNVFDLYSRVLFDALSGKILREFTKRVLILITIILIYLQLVNFNTFMICWLLANIIPTFLIVRILVRRNQFFLNPDFNFVDREMRKRLVNMSLFSLLTGASPLIVESIDRYFINDQLGLDATGVYSLAIYFATVITLPARSLYSIATTVVAESWKSNDLSNIYSIYKKSCINQLIATLFLFIIIWANVDNIFHYQPPGFAEGKYAVLFIGLAYLIDSATGISGVILSTSKYYRYDAYFYLLLIVVTVAGNMLLIPRYGITGAAIAFAITYLIFNVFRYLFILYVFKMHPLTIKNIYVVMIGTGVYFLTYYAFPPLNNYIADAIVRSTILTAGYWPVIYFFRFSDDINHTINEYLQKLKRQP